MNKLWGNSFVLLLIMPVFSSFAAALPDHSSSGILSSHPIDMTMKQNQSDPSLKQDIFYSVTQDDYVWKNGPASFPSGASYTVLEGDPYGIGPYTIRIKFPPYYKLPAHSHDDIEELTVISGVLYIAVGNELKEGDGFTLPPGGFTVISPKINHFVWTNKEGAIVQVHGTAPRISLYVDQKNDPTWKKTLQPTITEMVKMQTKTLSSEANETINTEKKKLPLIAETKTISNPKKSIHPVVARTIHTERKKILQPTITKVVEIQTKTLSMVANKMINIEKKKVIPLILDTKTISTTKKSIHSVVVEISHTDKKKIIPPIGSETKNVEKKTLTHSTAETTHLGKKKSIHSVVVSVENKKLMHAIVKQATHAGEKIFIHAVVISTMNNETKKSTHPVIIKTTYAEKKKSIHSELVTNKKSLGESESFGMEE